MVDRRTGIPASRCSQPAPADPLAGVCSTVPPASGRPVLPPSVPACSCRATAGSPPSWRRGSVASLVPCPAVFNALSAADLVRLLATLTYESAAWDRPLDAFQVAQLKSASSIAQHLA